MSKPESIQDDIEKLKKCKREQNKVRLVLDDGGQLSGTINWVEEDEVNITEDVGDSRRVTVELESIVQCYELSSTQVEGSRYSGTEQGPDYR